MTERRGNHAKASTRSVQEPDVISDQHQDAAVGQDFSRQMAEAPRGIVAEYWDFLWSNKRWWLTPIIIALLLVGVFVLLSATAAAPFIYTFF